MVKIEKGRYYFRGEDVSNLDENQKDELILELFEQVKFWQEQSQTNFDYFKQICGLKKW